MAHHPSFGAALAWDSAGGASYTAIGQVKDIAGPGIARGTVDVTDHDSTDGFREFLGGLVDGGEVTFVIGYDNANAQHAALITNLASTTCTKATFQLTLTVCSGTAVWTWGGFVIGFNPAAPVEGENTAEVGVKVSGKPILSIS